MAAKLDLSVIGTTGLKETGGWVFEEFLRRLQGIQGVNFYQEMRDNSAVIGGALFAINSLIMQVPWRIEPADESDKAKKWAEFIEGVLEDMSHTFPEFLVELLSMLPFGWAYHEIVYKLRRGDHRDPRFRSKFNDGLIGWRKLPLRGQDTLWRWEFDEHDGSMRGMWQNALYSTASSRHHGGMLFIPVEKALLFRTTTHKGNPEGRSIMRNAVTSYHSHKRAQQIELVGIERDMTGLLTMEMPIEYLQTQLSGDKAQIRDTLVKQLSSLKRDEREFAIVPPELDEDGKPTGWKLKLLTSGGRRQIDTNAVNNRYAREILMSMLAEVMMLGAEKGSWSLASSKTKLLSMALGALMDGIASVFNRFGIRRLMKLNNVPAELDPKLVHGDIETPPLDEIAPFLTAVTGAKAGGLFDDNPPLERKVLEIGKLPPPPEEAA